MRLALAHRTIGLLLLLVTLNFSAMMHPAFAREAPSAEDLARARELFNEGMDQRERGDPFGALGKLRAAHALADAPITGVELGRTYLALGRLVLARETFLSVERIERRRQETPRSTAARSEGRRLAEELGPRIPSVMLKTSGAAAATVTVMIDGESVPLDVLGRPRLLDPGKHSFVAWSADGATSKAEADLKEGETREVELTFMPKVTGPTSARAPTLNEPPAPKLSPEPSGVKAKRRRPGPLLYLEFGLGTAGLIVGSVTGIMAFSKASAVRSACDGSTCPRSVDGALQSGRTLATASTISFVAAGLGAATGVIGLLFAGRKEPAAPTSSSLQLWVGAAGLGVQGTY